MLDKERKPQRLHQVMHCPGCGRSHQRDDSATVNIACKVMAMLVGVSPGLVYLEHRWEEPPPRPGRAP